MLITKFKDDDEIIILPDIDSNEIIPSIRHSYYYYQIGENSFCDGMLDIGVKLSMVMENANAASSMRKIYYSYALVNGVYCVIKYNSLLYTALIRHNLISARVYHDLRKLVCVSSLKICKYISLNRDETKFKIINYLPTEGFIYQTSIRTTTTNYKNYKYDYTIFHEDKFKNFLKEKDFNIHDIVKNDIEKDAWYNNLIPSNKDLEDFFSHKNRLGLREVAIQKLREIKIDLINK